MVSNRVIFLIHYKKDRVDVWYRYVICANAANAFKTVPIHFENLNFVNMRVKKGQEWTMRFTGDPPSPIVGATVTDPRRG